MLGRQAALRLARAFGGARLYVPRSIQQRSPLAVALGIRAARLLSERFGGGTFDVPTARAEIRKANVLSLAHRGRDVGAIARAVGLSPRRVRTILSAADSAADTETGEASS